MLTISRPVIVPLCLALAGCGGPLVRNGPLKHWDRQAGYRFDALEPGPGNTDTLFIGMSFSGGGTRAAAFAYGVLLGLREAGIDCGTGEAASRRLLDEVDMISSVSGGSFTAMAYALWGERLFDGEFKKRFLTHNVQWDLILNLLKLKNLLRLPWLLLDRVDIAAHYYDEEIFKRLTYADLIDRNRRPFVVINATDVDRRRQFEFTQADFDLLGSDLATLPVGWAVAASSAFPLLFSPMRLKYYPGAAMTAAVDHVLTNADETEPPGRVRWARSLLKTDGTADATGDDRGIHIDAENHRYLYLVDGGLADNLGLSPIIASYRHGAIRRRIDADQIGRLVVIVVDAGTEPPHDIERRSSAPGLFTVGVATGTTSIDRHSETLTDLTRSTLLEARSELRALHQQCVQAIHEHCPEAPPPPLPAGADVETYLIDVNFRRIADAPKRRHFLSIVTSLFLPTEDVEALIEAGRTVLTGHSEFHRLLRDLQESAPSSVDDPVARDDLGPVRLHAAGCPRR